jgi:hypothetical protein
MIPVDDPCDFDFESVAAVEEDLRPSALSDDFELVCAPPALTARPGSAEPADAVPVDEPAEVFVDPLADDESATSGEPFLVEPLPAADPDSLPDSDFDDELEVDPDDDPVGGSADATPVPVKMATPTPRATASPPTRPTYLAAPTVSSWAGRPAPRPTVDSLRPAHRRFWRCVRFASLRPPEPAGPHICSDCFDTV